MTSYTPAVSSFGARRLDSKPMSENRNQITDAERLSQFEQQALQYTSLLFGIALKKTKNYQDAEDLVQETFVKAFKAWHQFEQGTNLQAWLTTILENTRKNLVAKKIRDKAEGGLDELEDFQIGTAESLTARPNRAAEVEALSRLTSKEVNDALDSILPQYSQVVRYAVFAELSYAEIAEKMGIPMGTVMSRLHRGKKELREKLAGYAKEEGYNVYTEDEMKERRKASAAKNKKGAEK